MNIKIIEVLCCVAGVIIFIMSDRSSVDARTVRNVRESYQDDTYYPFIDGLRIKPRRGRIIHPSDSEERDTDGYPFIVGLPKIPHRFGANLPSNIDAEAPEPFSFKNANAPKYINVIETDKNKAEEDFETTSDEYPFVNGLRRYRRSSGKFVDDAMVGNDGQYPFVDGLRKKKDDRRKPHRIFGHTDEEAQVGNDGAYPFVNGLRRRGSNSDQNQDKVEPFERTEEEYPFVNGLVDFTTTQASVYGHAIRKRSAEVENNATSPQPSPTTDAPRVSSTTRRGRYKPRRLPPPLMRIDFGKQSPTDTQLEIEVYYKPFRFGPNVNNLTVDVVWPTPNRKNDCPITYISVRNCQINADLENDQAVILEGGIGHPFVKLRITSFNFYLYQYAIFIFGDCRSSIVT